MKKKFIKLIRKSKFGRKIYAKIRAKKRKKMCIQIANTTAVKEKQIIFSAFQGRLYTCNPKAIYEYMITCPEYKDYTFVWAFNNPDVKRNLFHDRRTIVVKYNSKEFFTYLASSKYWVFNFKTTDLFVKKKDQVFVQCWHGTPLKRLGLDIEVDGNKATDRKEIHQSYLDDVMKYDYFVSPSKYASEKFISAFGLDKANKENIILEKGYPRNDALMKYDADKIQKIKEDLNIPEGKKVLLYCPTFRDNQYKKGVGHTYELGVNLLRLKEQVSDDYVLLLRLHYLVSNYINISQFVGFAYDVSNYDDVNDLYAVSDYLVTDYSSVFFDYANMKKPVLFYMYDLEEYKNNLRDFYIEIDEIPGPIIENEKDFITLLQGDVESVTNSYKDKYEQFCQRFTYLDDGEASQRVVKEFMHNENN